MAADLIIINGRVMTMDQAQPRAEAIATVGNKIVLLGKSDDASRRPRRRRFTS